MRQGQIPQHAEFLRACGESNPRCPMPERLIAPRLCHWTMPRRTKLCAGPTTLRPHTPENPTSGLALRISIHRLALRVWRDFFGEHSFTLADQRTRTRNLRQQYPNVLATGPNTFDSSFGIFKLHPHDGVVAMDIRDFS
ncbi:hypothetical protein RND71_028615 [Anisodus tanguticus]|uniref:Uncharacterized protein n=1 Tax=Anisodus tanguticus TaxID=243964 RepID=A0AAE1RLD2_9SOLA|nr:hypothetical protein RND71_028615 [Anisodus tanguticus]